MTSFQASHTGVPIVFFDGVCGLCNGFIDFLFRIDKNGRFKVAALQGTTAASILPAPLTADLRTIVVRDQSGGFRTKSDGVLYVLSTIGGKWAALAGMCRVFPRPLRDVVYDLVARTRYSIFGKRSVCRMPTPAERGRFLD